MFLQAMVSASGNMDLEDKGQERVQGKIIHIQTTQKQELLECEDSASPSLNKRMFDLASPAQSPS